jgi:2,5-dihydroxypyridine 5,6-dioxygenase
MLRERIEGQGIDCFAEVFGRCGVAAGDAAAILSETQSRAVNVELAELALLRLGCRPVHLVVPTPRLAAPAPVRSTGASDALGRLAPAVAALARSVLVVDLTVEGLLHAAELPEILAGGARVLMVSNEHPEILERCLPDPALESKVREGMRMLRAARLMRVVSPAGTALEIALEGARVGGVWGYTAKPGTVAHWPGGICLAFPRAKSVNGTLVLAPGDVNLTFKRYLRDTVRLRIVDDYVREIEGAGVDADMMRGYFASWGDAEAYAVSHVGWGMNPGARWDAMTFYDRRDFNGTELRAFAGNFLYSTGANEVAGRHTLGHFDLPLRNCTVSLDGRTVVDEGRLLPPLA